MFLFNLCKQMIACIFKCAKRFYHYIGLLFPYVSKRYFAVSLVWSDRMKKTRFRHSMKNRILYIEGHWLVIKCWYRLMIKNKILVWNNFILYLHSIRTLVSRSLNTLFKLVQQTIVRVIYSYHNTLKTEWRQI